MPITTGLSGNEIYCLAQKGFDPGNIVVGNSVHALGVLRTIGTGLKYVVGGELAQITQLIEEGREAAFNRMLEEADRENASGITGVSSELIFHTGNIEFLSIGSIIHANEATHRSRFTTSANGQELFAQLDAGFDPISFVFGNVAYSLGISRGIIGGLKTFVRGEVKEYSDMFNHTRHLALERIIAHARKCNANAVLGIRTTILPFMGTNEMLMIGTASHTKQFISQTTQQIITSDLTNIEMWNLAKIGYMPLRLLLGTSVYSLGFVGSISALLKSFVRGEITELTKLIYHARENALALINQEAKEINADDVVGVKTYVYQLPGGLIEFLAIGTAVKKMPSIKPESAQLPPQAMIIDQDTFYDTSVSPGFNVNVSAGSRQVKSVGLGGIFSGIVFFIIIIVYLIMSIMSHR
jgi:uncharacterized protein YbjQ (UPF0145 family)